MDAMPPAVVTQEVRIVDETGQPGIVLSGKSGVATIQLLGSNGEAGLDIRLDGAGRPGVRLSNPSSSGPTAALEVDDKGAHVKFDRPGGASSYLFLNNEGGSGVVLIDGQGKRRMIVTLDPNGAAKIERCDPAGKPLR